jgi:hypothetical protein
MRYRREQTGQQNERPMTDILKTKKANLTALLHPDKVHRLHHPGRKIHEKTETGRRCME